jgi:hypothetical protein
MSNENIDFDLFEEVEDKRIIKNDNEIPGLSAVGTNVKVFDPRIIDNSKTLQIWTSESVNLAIRGMREGYKLIDSPFNKAIQGANLRKSNLPFNYTEDEKRAIEYSIDDIVFFSNSFVKLKDADEGWSNITLRDYQENLLQRYDDNRFNIIMFPRQSGKTTTTIAKILHFLIFSIDKDCVVIAQSDPVVTEILEKIKTAFENLPFFIQPGFISFNDDGFSLDNGCRLKIGIAAESVVQGFSLDMLYIDEFAYVPQSKVNKFWVNIYPALVNNPKSRCIVTSTPNGRNKFYDLWIGAINKLNEFIPYRLYWYDVPGRDEKFKEETIRNIGLDGWELGFECSFDTGLKTIFSTKTQKYLRKIQFDFAEKWKDEGILKSFGFECLDQKIVSYDLKKDYFIAGIDIAEGLDQDESTIKFKKIEWDIENKRLQYKSVAIFHDNTISVTDLAKKTLDVLKFFNPDNVKLTVENNTFGAEYFMMIDNLILNEPSKYGKINKEIFVQYKRKSTQKFEKGVKWNEYNKRAAVKAFSTLISSKIMFEYHPLSIEQYLNFGKQETKGTSKAIYRSNYGHDDLVMADISNSYFLNVNNIFTSQFLTIVEQELRVRVQDEPLEVKQKRAEEERKEREKHRFRGWVLRNSEEHLPVDVNNVFLFEINEYDYATKEEIQDIMM